MSDGFEHGKPASPGLLSTVLSAKDKVVADEPHSGQPAVVVTGTDGAAEPSPGHLFLYPKFAHLSPGGRGTPRQPK